MNYVWIALSVGLSFAIGYFARYCQSLRMPNSERFWKFAKKCSLPLLIAGLSFAIGYFARQSQRPGVELANEVVKTVPAGQQPEKLELTASTGNLLEAARKHFDEGQYATALELFEKKIAAGGEKSELSFAHYCTGLAQEALGMSPDEFTSSYNRSFLESQKIEPLHRLAAYHLRSENTVLAYLLLDFARKLPPPPAYEWRDAMIHDYGLLYSFSGAAFFMGKFDESAQAMEEVLRNPNLPSPVREEIARNLSLAQERSESARTYQQPVSY